MPLVPLANIDATDALARRLAPLLRAGDVVALYGGLGAGKTTFCRALISSLMGRETEVPSPTYTLVQTYEAPDFPVFHFDLYRLEDPSHLVELGWQETVDGVTLVEWPENAGSDLPAWRLNIKLSISEKSRTAALAPQGEDWQTRLHGF
ncbi:MAG: tRNA (adenosine(37)-N6)-threonylcarbamoyltransferase complex ATPase subunit type 1 TsaE [Henriciella sp.]